MPNLHPALLASLLASFTAAQTTFSRGTPRPLSDSPFNYSDTLDILVADFNRDGRRDLYFCNRARPSQRVAAVADWAFESLPLTFADTPRTKGTVADLDGDGDPDMVFATIPQVLVNDGTGAFSARGIFPTNGSCVAVGDVNGDGAVDIVLGFRSAQNRLFTNLGNLSFREVTTTNLPLVTDDTVSITLIDVDGDGDLDLVSGNVNEQNRLALNDGQGRFTNVTATHMPLAAYATNSVRAGDLDGDGDRDLVIGVDWNGGATNRIYLNNGTGRFTDATASRVPSWNGLVELLDCDGDLDLDIFVGSLRAQPQLFVNDGSGVFVNGTAGRLPAMTPSLLTAVAADLDADGATDLVLGCEAVVWAPEPTGRNVVLRNRNGVFVEEPQPLKEPWGGVFPAPPMSSNSIVPLDSDRDGDIDLIIGNDFQQQNRYFRNDGNGVFTDATSTHLPVDSDNTIGMAAGDVDADGRADLVLTNYDGQTRLYLGRSDGGFDDATAGRMPRANLQSVCVALRDLDGDGDLDIALGTTTDIRLYLNDGSGFFTGNLSLGSGSISSPVLGLQVVDINNDRRADIVFQTATSVVALVNLGGTFFQTRFLVGGGFPTPWVLAMLLFDADRDGDVDLFSTQSSGSNSTPTAILSRNDGQGTFAQWMTTGGDGNETQLATADLDGDGDLDVVASSTPFSTTDIRGGRCQAFFIGASSMTSARISNNLDGGRGIAVADLDGDGDQDVILANKPWALGGGQSRIYFNQTRHVTVPEFTRIGGVMTVRTHASAPGATGISLATATFLSLSLASPIVPLPPYGDLRLGSGLTLLATGPTVPILFYFEQNLPIPPQSSLRGVSVYLQALVEGRDATNQPVFRLTNALRETIR